VQLGRRPAEAPDADLRAFYDQLLGWLQAGDIRRGSWTLLDVDSVDGASDEALVAWGWEVAGAWHVVVVNLGAQRGTGIVRCPAGDLDVDLEGGHHTILSV
jgi:hypothetical protein